MGKFINLINYKIIIIMKTIALFALIAGSNAIRMRDDPICSSTGCNVNHYADEGASAHPVDYVVPDYGADPEIKATADHIHEAEHELEHTYAVKDFKVPAGPPSNYVVPNFGVDQDILSTAVSINAA